eukprot:381421_1
MHRLFTLFCSSSLVSLISALCDHGYWSAFHPDFNGSCAFICFEGTSVAQNDLEFDEIKDKCEHVQYGARWDDCLELDHLVWNGCSCPHCRCDATNAGVPTTWEIATQGYVIQECFNCSCEASPHSGATDNLYQCVHVSSTDGSYNWDDFTCPASDWDDWVYCEDGDDKHPTSTSWFADVADGELCNTFCYCDGDGVKECRTGYEVIFTEGSDELKTAFYKTCEFVPPSLDSCWDHPDLMSSSDTGPYCSRYSSCPICGCPSDKSINDTYWVTATSTVELSSSFLGFGNYQDTISCLQCRCVQGTDGNVEQCKEVERYPASTSLWDYGCQPAKTISCHVDSNYDGTLSATANYETFYTNSPVPWCHVTFHGDTRLWQWSYDDGFFCGVYGKHGCIKRDWAYEYRDCYGNTHSQNTTDYVWCCQADECNYLAPSDTSNCVEEQTLNAYSTEMSQCIGVSLGSEDCEDEEDVTCMLIAMQYKVRATCMCKAYQKMYNDAMGVSSDWGKWAQSYIDMMMTTFTFTSGLGCAGSVSCNLATGDISGEFRDYGTIYQLTTTTTKKVSNLSSATDGICGSVGCTTIKQATVHMPTMATAAPTDIEPIAALTDIKSTASEYKVWMALVATFVISCFDQQLIFRL